MVGPMAARMRSRRAPARSIWATVASTMPATGRASQRAPHGDFGFWVSEQNRRAVGRQYPDDETGYVETTASAFGRASRGTGPSTRTAVPLWT